MMTGFSAQQGGLMLAVSALFAIWLVGAVHMWRKQSASRALVSVRAVDRLVAVLWPLIYLVALFMIALVAARQLKRDG